MRISFFEVERGQLSLLFPKVKKIIVLGGLKAKKGTRKPSEVFTSFFLKKGERKHPEN